MTISEYASKAYAWLRSEYRPNIQDETPLEKRTKTITYFEGVKEGSYVALGFLASNDPVAAMIIATHTLMVEINLDFMIHVTSKNFEDRIVDPTIPKDFSRYRIDLIVKRGTQFVGGVAGGCYKMAASLLSSIASRIIYLLPEKFFYLSNSPQATQCKDTGFIGRIMLAATGAAIGGALLGPMGSFAGAFASGALLGGNNTKKV